MVSKDFLMRLQNKVALITGGNSGIGKATALLFAQEGARVMIAARDQAKAASTAASIRAAGGIVEFIACDVREPAACTRAVEATVAAFGQVDVLFNNAGVVPYGTLLDTSVETWLDCFATNVHGTFYMTRAVVPDMVARRGGVIINNASDWAVVGGQNATAYSATKGAVVQFTKCVALDYGRLGIRINAVCPGDTAVERWQTTYQDRVKHNPELAGSADFESYTEKLGESFALGRVGSPDEIARAVLFLACDDSSYMTGQLLVVDGGNTAGGSSTRF